MQATDNVGYLYHKFIRDFPTVLYSIKRELVYYLKSNNLKSMILGVSGGIDSALVAAIGHEVCLEYPEFSLVGLSIPIQTNHPDELARAPDIGQFCTHFEERDLSDAFYHVIPPELALMIKNNNDLTSEEKVRIGNAKARFRMIHLYNEASLHRGLVLSTDNYTEYLLGYWTLHGDVGDFGPIQHLWKTEVFDFTEFMIKFYTERSEDMKVAALTPCLLAAPTAGLGISRSDLEEIDPEWYRTAKSHREGFKNVDELLIEFLYNGVNYLSSPERFTWLTGHPVIRRHLFSQFKRNNPYCIPRSNLFLK